MITEQDVEILPGFSPRAADLLRGLLQRNPENRLGVNEIKAHPFFETLRWDSKFFMTSFSQSRYSLRTNHPCAARLTFETLTLTSRMRRLRKLWLKTARFFRQQRLNSLHLTEKRPTWIDEYAKFPNRFNNTICFPSENVKSNSFILVQLALFNF